MLQISALYIYPIKSLGGFAVNSALVTDRGLQYDRRWMLVDASGIFLSQRRVPQMALLQVSLEGNHLQVQHKQKGEKIKLPLLPQSSDVMEVTVWDSRSKAIQVSAAADQWFTKQLGLSCRLVYMPDEKPIAVDVEYAHRGEVTSFSDGYPFLLIGQSSLDDLNGRLPQPVPMNRFRPNLVIWGGAPFAEDQWKILKTGTLEFYGVKRCARCVVTTINQDNMETGKEPLKTLATYRMEENKIYFGQNLLHQGSGVLRVGDAVAVAE